MCKVLRVKCEGREKTRRGEIKEKAWRIPSRREEKAPRGAGRGLAGRKRRKSVRKNPAEGRKSPARSRKRTFSLLCGPFVAAGGMHFLLSLTFAAPSRPPVGCMSCFPSPLRPLRGRRWDACPAFPLLCGPFAAAGGMHVLLSPTSAAPSRPPASLHRKASNFRRIPV